jgi:hypothetical protein
MTAPPTIGHLPRDTLSNLGYPSIHLDTPCRSYTKRPVLLDISCASYTQIPRQTHQQTLALSRLRQCPHDCFHHEGGGTHPPTTSPVTQQQQHYLALLSFCRYITYSRRNLISFQHGRGLMDHPARSCLGLHEYAQSHEHTPTQH